jgi:hypothetical protein
MSKEGGSVSHHRNEYERALVVPFCPLGRSAGRWTPRGQREIDARREWEQEYIEATDSE